MPRPPKPVEMLELTGTFRHGQRRQAPRSECGFGDPPACLAPDEPGCWAEFVANAAEGVLTSGDRIALEALARLHAKSRRDGLTGAEWGHLRGFLSELGATPASRSRVLPAGSAEALAANPWDVPAPHA